MSEPTNSATILAVIKKPHDDLGADTYHYWVSLGEAVKADRRGHLNPRMWTTEWHKWVCNNPQCRAWGIVSEACGRLALEEAE